MMGLEPGWIELMSWVAAGCTCLSLYWIASKSHLKRLNGWTFGIVGACWWMIYSIVTGQAALLVVNLVIAALQIRGFHREA